MPKFYAYKRSNKIVGLRRYKHEARDKELIENLYADESITDVLENIEAKDKTEAMKVAIKEFRS